MLYPEILEWKPSSMMHRPEMSARRKPTLMLFALDSWVLLFVVAVAVGRVARELSIWGDFRGAFNFSEQFNNNNNGY